MAQPVDITTITSANWQLSNAEYGQVAVGAYDILMCVHNIVFTIKGEVPFRPTLGSDIMNCIDLPANRIVAVVNAMLYDCITRWEKRVTVDKVISTISANGDISWEVQMIAIGASGFLGYTLTLSTSNSAGRAFSDGFSFPSFE